MTIQIEDNDDNLVRLLREIRDAVQGGTLPGQKNANNRQQTEVRVHDIAGRYTPPQSAFNLANQEWTDESLAEVSFDGDLAPGDSEVVALIESNDKDVFIGVNAGATTEHRYDVDGDGKDESAVRYYHEFKGSQSNNWTPAIGLTTTMPLGRLSDPEEYVPGTIIGPMKGWRIRIENRTDETANSTTISADELGGQLTGVIMRTGGN